MISNPREWQICLQQRVTPEERGTNRHTGGRVFPNMGWLLLWETWKLMVNKEIRFASQRVWKTRFGFSMWRCAGAVPELCPAPGGREGQQGGQQQVWKLQGPCACSRPFLEEMKPVPSLWCSSTEPSEPGAPLQPFPFLEEILNTPGSVKVLQKHRDKNPWNSLSSPPVCTYCPNELEGN